jgi:hypothetical protein
MSTHVHFACVSAKCIFTLFLGVFVAGCGPGASPENNGQAAAQNKSVPSPETVQDSSGEQQKQVLWDFRTETAKEQKFSKAETQVVMKYLFGDRWDPNLYISGRFNGSFSKPNANETLYYVGGCDEDDGQGFKATTNCAHVSWWNAGWIAIFEGTTPVTKIQAVLGYQVAKVTDVNNDGISEILSLAGYSNQGETETTPLFGRISEGKYQEIKTLSGAADTCGGDPIVPLRSKATVITYIPTGDGKMPDLTEEYFENKCGKTPWKKITKKQFDAD